MRVSAVCEGLWLEKKPVHPDRKSPRNPAKHYTIKLLGIMVSQLLSTEHKIKI